MISDSSEASSGGSMDLFSLKDRVALVTGGTSGLGLAIADGFADAGAHVIVASRHPTQNKALSDLPHLESGAIGVDVTDRASVESMVQRVMDERGRIDILVNSAGVGARSPAEACVPELWDRAISVNLTGTFNCCQIAGRAMLDTGNGSIINIASIGGVVGIPGSSAYQASKGGVVQLTRSLAVEWASRGIRVNALAPSQFDTPLVRRQWNSEPEMKASFIDRTPLGRVGQPRELVGPAIFLASDASSMVTGLVLLVDGGYTAQ